MYQELPFTVDPTKAYTTQVCLPGTVYRHGMDELIKFILCYSDVEGNKLDYGEPVFMIGGTLGPAPDYRLYVGRNDYSAGWFANVAGACGLCMTTGGLAEGYYGFVKVKGYLGSVPYTGTIGAAGVPVKVVDNSTNGALITNATAGYDVCGVSTAAGSGGLVSVRIWFPYGLF